MKFEMFFEKFDPLADAPIAVGKLRELVLRLAFSGSLSDKTPGPDGLPTGWSARTVEMISSSITPGFACAKTHQVEDGHVHLRTHNISTLGTLNFDLLVRIDPAKVDPQKASIPHGDVLFNNTNSQELVGKTCLVDRDYDYGFGNHITRIRLAKDVESGYLVYYFTLLSNSGHFARLCNRWINQAGINTNVLRKQTVPVPPLAEQKRIVAKVDELMALCDRLEAQQQERDTRHAALARASLARFAETPTPDNLDFLFHDSYAIEPADLRKTILTLAVQGRLVPQDPNDEPAAVVLARIQGERNSAVTKRQISPMKAYPPAELTDLTFTPPSAWEIVRMCDLLMEIQTGPFGSSLHKSDYKSGGTPVINPASLNGGKIIPIKEMAVEGETLERLATFRLEAGDIVMARRGEMGRCAVVTEHEQGWLCGTGSLVLRLPKAIYAPYLAMLIGSPSAREYLGGASVGTTMRNLNQSILAKMTVAVPPLAEQRRIAARVDQLMAMVDQLEAQLAAARTTVTNLMNAMVAELTAEN